MPYIRFRFRLSGSPRSSCFHPLSSVPERCLQTMMQMSTSSTPVIVMPPPRAFDDGAFRCCCRLMPAHVSESPACPGVQIGSIVIGILLWTGGVYQLCTGFVVMFVLPAIGMPTMAFGIASIVCGTLLVYGVAKRVERYVDIASKFYVSERPRVPHAVQVVLTGVYILLRLVVLAIFVVWHVNVKVDRDDGEMTTGIAIAVGGTLIGIAVLIGVAVWFYIVMQMTHKWIVAKKDFEAVVGKFANPVCPTDPQVRRSRRRWHRTRRTRRARWRRPPTTRRRCRSSPPSPAVSRRTNRNIACKLAYKCDLKKKFTCTECTLYSNPARCNLVKLHISLPHPLHSNPVRLFYTANFSIVNE